MELDRLSAYTQTQVTNVRANAFVQLVSSLAHDDGGQPRRLSDVVDLRRAFDHHAIRWPNSLCADIVTKGVERLCTKAGVSPGISTDTTWAAPLAAVRPLSEAFVDVARPASL